MKLKRLFKQALNVVLLIPFIMILGTVFIINHELASPVVSGKYFWFYCWMGISSLSVFIMYFINNKNIHWQLTDFLVLLFGITALTSSYFAGREINTKWILLLLCVMLYFYFRMALSANKLNRYLLLVFFITTGLAEAVWGLMQLYGFSTSQHHQFLLTGSFYNPGPYAGYLAAAAPAALYYLLTGNNVFSRKFNSRFIPFYLRGILSLTALAAIILVLPAAMSRASWLAALAGCIFTALMVVLKKYKLSAYFKQHKKQISLLGAALLIAAIAGGAGMYYMKKDSADGRTLMWKISLCAIPEYPFGAGLNHFSGAYGSEQAAYFASGLGTDQEKYVAGSPEYAFNEYLQLCIELGIIPFLLFISVVVSLFYSFYTRRFKRSMRQVSLRSGSGEHVVLGSLISLLVFASMSYPFNLLPFIIIFVFLLASAVPPQVLNKTNKDTVITIIILVLFSSLTACCLYSRQPAYQAYKEWNTLKILYNMEHYQEAEKNYEKLYPCLKDQAGFLFEHGRTLSNIEKYEQSNKILHEAALISCDPMLYNIMGKNYQSLKKYEQAELYYLKAADIIPSRHYPFYLLAKLYVEQGCMEKAVDMAGFVIAKEAKVPSPAINEMKDEMKRIVDKSVSER